MIPVYFLCLMADGRKLQERLPGAPTPISTAFFADAHEGESLLITSEYPQWMARPFIETDEAAIEPQGTDEILS